jgi:hypothetical protein
LALLLLASCLPAFFGYATFSENKNLLKQAEQLSLNFSANDLVLVDKDAAGNGWDMLSEPLSVIYGKNAAYFFNTQDLSRLDLQKFDSIYLIAPEKQLSFYSNSVIGEKIINSKDYTLETTRLKNQLDIPGKALSLPEKENVVVHGKILRLSK